MTTTCQICKAPIHIVKSHLDKEHTDWTVERYREEFPLAKMLSDEAIKIIESKKKEQGEVKSVVVKPLEKAADETKVAFLHEVFDFGSAPAARNARGEPIKIRLGKVEGDDKMLVPEIDRHYIFDINLVKLVVMSLEMNIPVYLWGHAGTGKTTLLEQVCARTNRPFLRIQHTANTEEADIEGSWRVDNGNMRFEYGPLAEAMKKGYVFAADEYDFASPMVTSLYQAVLEGKPLRIKAANEVIHPHPDFRIVATGNTNGTGDESSLYAGTQIQNAANYERFGIVSKVEYMEAKQEEGILKGRFGLDAETARKLVNYANTMRASFEKRDVAIPMSPRALQNAVLLGQARDNWTFGIQQAYINRLPSTSARTAAEIAQRIFG